MHDQPVQGAVSLSQSATAKSGSVKNDRNRKAVDHVHTHLGAGKKSLTDPLTGRGPMIGKKLEQQELPRAALRAARRANQRAAEVVEAINQARLRGHLSGVTPNGGTRVE